MTVFYEHHLIYQSSAPSALLEEPVPVIDSEPFTESPGPVARAEFYLGDSQPMVEEVPAIGSGWFDDAPPVVFPRPDFLPSQTESDLFSPVIEGHFSESLGPVLRLAFYEGLTIAEVPHPGEEGGAAADDSIQTVIFDFPIIYQASAPSALLAEDEVALVDDVFTESPGPVLRPAFYVLPSGITEEDVPPIGSGWFTNPPLVVERVPFHLSLTEADLTNVPPIGSGWFTNLQPAPPRVPFYPSLTEVDLTDVPDIGVGWFTNPPQLILRPLYLESRTEFDQEQVVVVVGDLVFSESPGPTLRIPGLVSRTDVDLTDVPLIGSGWFDDAPPIVFRPGFYESLTASSEEDVPDIGVGWFTNPPDMVERPEFFLSITEFEATEVPPIASGWYMDAPPIVYARQPAPSNTEFTDEVPEIGSGWFRNPPPVILRPFVVFPGEPPGDLLEALAAEEAFSEGPYLLLRQPFYESIAEPMLEEVTEIGSGWFTNPPPIVFRPGYFMSRSDVVEEDVPDIGVGWFTNPPDVVERPEFFLSTTDLPQLADVPLIGSGWFTNPPPIIYRPGYFPSSSDVPFDIPPFIIVVKGPLSAVLVHIGQSMAIEVTDGTLKVVEVPSTIAGFAFLVHQGASIAEEITDGTLKAEEC